MTDAYFYVNIPYHRPAPPSFLRLLQRWAGPLLLGTALAALAWHQDHQSAPAAPVAAAQPVLAAPAPAPSADALTAEPVATPADTSQAQLATTSTPVEQSSEHTGAHPALVFHNCSMPRMEVRKDHNDLITGVASVSSCDEAKVTLWDTSR